MPRKCQGNFKVREFVWKFYVASGKNEVLPKCQGNVRELYKFQFVSNDKQKMAREVFLTFWIHAKFPAKIL